MRPRTALLARPHPAIGDAMRVAVAACGLEPRPLSSRDELLAWPGADVALIVGAVGERRDGMDILLVNRDEFENPESRALVVRAMSRLATEPVAGSEAGA